MEEILVLCVVVGGVRIITEHSIIVYVYIYMVSYIYDQHIRRWMLLKLVRKLGPRLHCNQFSMESSTSVEILQSNLRCVQQKIVDINPAGINPQ